MTPNEPADDSEGPAPNRSPPRPDLRLVEGTARIDVLDAFLARVEEVGTETGAVIQAFDARYVVDAEHLRRATRLAARSMARGEAVARDPAVEVLVYAAGRRQIDRALELGVSTGENHLVVVLADFGDVPNAGRPSADLDAAEQRLSAVVSPESTLGTVDGAVVRRYYDVTDRELSATAGDLRDVVHERVALLDVEK